MKISNRAQNISESVTLKLNSMAVQMAEEGKKVFNLTAGQLPFRPLNEFTNIIGEEVSFLKSFQYSPVPGFSPLREKLIDKTAKSRNVTLDQDKFDCIVSNGGKHALSNVFSTLIDEGDEVILLAPHWVSYTEMVKLNGGTPVVVNSNIYNVFTPSIDDLKSKITLKTKAIVINSPNNPSGIHYNEAWMKDFAAMITDYPEITIISDEIYFDLYYFDPKPVFYYQFNQELLDRTIIIDGISKTLASTGLRIGYTIAPKDFVKAMSRIQGQTASGANSLIQRALMNFDFNLVEEFLIPIKSHLRANSEVIKDKLYASNLSKCWYQSNSAFYFLIDFAETPVYERMKAKFTDKTDLSMEICQELLQNYGVAIVPGTDFGTPNTARLSLVLQKDPFTEAIDKLVNFLAS